MHSCLLGASTVVHDSAMEDKDGEGAGCIMEHSASTVETTRFTANQTDLNDMGMYTGWITCTYKNIFCGKKCFQMMTLLWIF